MKRTLGMLKDAVSPSRRRNNVPAPRIQPPGSFRNARSLQEFNGPRVDDDGSESKGHIKSPHGNVRLNLRAMATAGATLGESQGSFGGSGPPPEGVSPRTKLTISADRKKRTLHKFQVSTTTAAAFLAIREDNAFRAKVFGVRSKNGTGDDDETAARKRGGCPILLPSHPLRWVWDSLFCWSMLWVFCRWPFLVAFGSNTTVALEVVDAFAELLYLLDIVGNFFTAYVDDGDLVTTHAAIVWHYVRTWFIVDAVLAVPYTFLFPNTLWPLVGACRIIHVDRLWAVEALALRRLELTTRQTAVFRLLKLGFYVGLAGHVSACLWYLMAKEDQFTWNSWTTLYGVNHLPLPQQYMISLYWAFTTLTTVGYGDIVPHTVLERAFAMFLILAGAVTFGAIVGKISSLSAAMNRRHVAEQEHLTALDEFLRFYALPRGMRQQTRMHNTVMSRLFPFRHEAHLVDGMAPPMRRAVLMHVHRHIIQAQPVLKFSSLGFQTRVVEYLQPTFCLEGTYMLVYGEVAEEVYFISNGTVRQVNRWGFCTGQLDTGSFFGEGGVLDHETATSSVLATSNCELYSLSRTHLRRLLQDFPEFEGTLRKVATLRNQSLDQSPGEKKAPVPYGLTTWQEVAETRNFDKFYSNVLSRSRTLQAVAYKPEPQVLAVTVPDNLRPLIEYVTRNAHELWCADRLAEGWEFAPSSNHLAKQSASLRPFDGLHESQQITLRQASVTLVKLLLKHGYRITPKDGNPMQAVEQWPFSEPDDDSAESAWVPNPCRLGQDMSLPPSLHDIACAAAREDHLMWSAKAKEAGWSWGPKRSGKLRQHERLLPFQFLSEVDKARLVERAVLKIRSMIGAGFNVRVSRLPSGVLGRVHSTRSMRRVPTSLPSDGRDHGARGASPARRHADDASHKLEERMTELERMLRQVATQVKRISDTVCPESTSLKGVQHAATRAKRLSKAARRRSDGRARGAGTSAGGQTTLAPLVNVPTPARHELAGPADAAAQAQGTSGASAATPTSAGLRRVGGTTIMASSRIGSPPAGSTDALVDSGGDDV